MLRTTDRLMFRSEEKTAQEYMTSRLLVITEFMVLAVLVQMFISARVIQRPTIGVFLACIPVLAAYIPFVLISLRMFFSEKIVGIWSSVWNAVFLVITALLVFGIVAFYKSLDEIRSVDVVTPICALVIIGLVTLGAFVRMVVRTPRGLEPDPDASNVRL